MSQRLLWRIEKLMDSITYYQYEGLIFFGSTPGDDGYAFRRSDKSIVKIQFIDIGEEPKFCAKTFEQFIYYLYTNTDMG